MMRKDQFRFIFFVSLLFLLWVTASSCQLLPGNEDIDVVEATVFPLDLNDLPPEFINVQGEQIRQWAIEAEAGSEYANPEWAAEQATGAPDTLMCGDYQTAWATAGSDSKDWLEVRFPVAVQVTGINIYESFNPNQVVMVELLDSFGRTFTVYDQPPDQVDQPCPYTLFIPVERTEGFFDTVRISVDQSFLGLGWNQIDAVELVGVSDNNLDEIIPNIDSQVLQTPTPPATDE